MSYLTFCLTPPRLADPVAKLHPMQFLREPIMLSSLKRASSLELDERSQKLLCLDPAFEKEDRTIYDYWQHHDPSAKLRISLPVPEYISHMNDRITALEVYYHAS